MKSWHVSPFNLYYLVNTVLVDKFAIYFSQSNNKERKKTNPQKEDGGKCIARIQRAYQKITA